MEEKHLSHFKFNTLILVPNQWIDTLHLFLNLGALYGRHLHGYKCSIIFLVIEYLKFFEIEGLVL